MNDRLNYITDPKRRGYWVVAIVILALSYGGHRVASGALAAEAAALKVTQNRLETNLSAEHTLRLRAEADKSVTDAALSATRERGRLAGVIAREEGRRASEAILVLGTAVDSLELAGDSVVAIVIVRGIQAEHRIERAADAVVIAGLEADTTAFSGALALADTVIVHQGRELFVYDSISANVLLQTAIQDARLALALNPPFTVELVKGGKWVAAGAIIGFLLAR